MNTKADQTSDVLVVITARASSARWPNKYVKLLPKVVSRVRESGLPFRVLTPSVGVESFCHSRDYPVLFVRVANRPDLMAEFKHLRRATEDVKLYLHVTGDSPLIDPKALSYAYKLRMPTQLPAYIVNGEHSGQEVRCLSGEYLDLILEWDTFLRTHGPAVYTQRNHCAKRPRLEAQSHTSPLNLSVDTKEGYLSLFGDT